MNQNIENNNMTMNRINRIVTVALMLTCLLATACQKDGAVPGSAAFFNWNTAGANPFEDENMPEVLPGFDDDGASVGVFTVGLSTKVRFSRGNLQFQGITASWRFAGHQYDYIGADNEMISIVNEGWIDLFGWGTSGWNSGAREYQPYSISDTASDYMPGREVSADLNGAYAEADWGVHNAITNGGNKAGMWRTLSRREWQYLMGETYADIRVGKWGLTTIDGQYRGVVILPDDWETPSSLTFTSGSEGGWTTNEYGLEAWDLMESSGAIFLPAAGARYGKEVQEVGEKGNYWSATHYNPDRSYSLNFSDQGIMADSHPYRWAGFSVRLVKPL